VKGKSFAYHFAAAWSQEIGGYKNADQFFNFVKKWDSALRNPVKIVRWK
jgi:hypothetical protein